MKIHILQRPLPFTNQRQGRMNFQWVGEFEGQGHLWFPSVGTDLGWLNKPSKEPSIFSAWNEDSRALSTITRTYSQVATKGKTMC